MASTTFGTYKTILAGLIGLDSSAEASLINLWVNQGYERFIADTHCYINTSALDFTADQDTYDLPTGAMAIHEMYVLGTDGQPTGGCFERVSLPELISMKRVATSSAPARYYATVGANMFVVHPTPDSSDEQLYIYYVVRPTAMSSDDDLPTGIPAEFHQALEYWALARAAEYDSHGPSQFGLFYRGLYEAEVRRCKSAIQKMGGNRPAPLKAGYRDSYRASSDRSRIFNW
jgi:hypothetical protein